MKKGHGFLLAGTAGMSAFAGSRCYSHNGPADRLPNHNRYHANSGAQAAQHPWRFANRELSWCAGADRDHCRRHSAVHLFDARQRTDRRRAGGGFRGSAGNSFRPQSHITGYKHSRSTGIDSSTLKAPSYSRRDLLLPIGR